jgi:hypothetical protein
LGARVIFSRACRPSRTAHLTLSPGFPGLGPQALVGGVSLAARRPPRGTPHSLPPTLRTKAQRPTPGCGKAPQGLLSLRGDASLCTGSVGFTGSRAGTVGPSLIHSCAPELSGVGSLFNTHHTRQGIWLPIPQRPLHPNRVERTPLRGSELGPGLPP